MCFDLAESKIHNKSTTNLQLDQTFTANPQQIHNKSTTRRKFVQKVVQQIHNKSNKWSLSFSVRCELVKLTGDQCGTITEKNRKQKIG